jgi:hypothetical protein
VTSFNVLLRLSEFLHVDGLAARHSFYSPSQCRDQRGPSNVLHSSRGVAEAALHHFSRPLENSRIPSRKNVQFTCVNKLPLKS